jgi:hypothetical protein
MMDENRVIKTETLLGHYCAVVWVTIINTTGDWLWYSLTDILIRTRGWHGRGFFVAALFDGQPELQLGTDKKIVFDLLKAILKSVKLKGLK